MLLSLSLSCLNCRDMPLANDNPEDPASCKWSSGGTGLLQIIIRHPNHFSQDLDSILRTFLEQFALFYGRYGCIYAKRYYGQIVWNACTWFPETGPILRVGDPLPFSTIPQFVIFDHVLMLWFQKDSLDTVGFRTYGGGFIVINLKVTLRVLNVSMGGAQWAKSEGEAVLIQFSGFTKDPMHDFNRLFCWNSCDCEWSLKMIDATLILN